MVVLVWLAGGDVTRAQFAGATFNPGIYYRLPDIGQPAARLARLDDPLLPEFEMSPVGWDMCRDQLVFPTPQGLTLMTAPGHPRDVAPRGLFRIARPSFSPDCRHVAVQASAVAEFVDGAEDLNIYVIDIETAEWVRVGDLPWNEESPRFFPVGARLAYSSALPATDFALDERFRNVPGMPDRGVYPLDAAFSPDGTQVVLDWALRRGDAYGNVLMRLSLDARQLVVLTDLIPANPAFTNQNNFSQLNPVWK